MSEAEQDIIDATFRLGQVAGWMLKHRRTHPDQVERLQRMMIEIGTAGLELIQRDSGRAAIPAPDQRARFKEYALAKGYLASDLEDFVGSGAPREGEYHHTGLQDLWEAFSAGASA